MREKAEFELIVEQCVSLRLVERFRKMNSGSLLTGSSNAEVVMEGRPGVLRFMGSQRVGHD